VSTPYRSFTEPAQAVRQIRDLSPKTVILDVEPLIACWDTNQEVLDDGLTAILDQLAADPGQLRQIVFATNSARRPSTPPAIDGLHVSYLALAGKPLRIARYQDLPTPAVVVGDQLATDGVLAWRLGYTFLHYTPSTITMPFGPRLMNNLGRPLRTILFHTS
jgi:predicted HAD superfamily phosphohydrolase YqeG